LYSDRKRQKHGFRKNFSFFQGIFALLPNLTHPPTSPQPRIVLIGEDYGLKVGIRKNKGRAISVIYHIPAVCEADSVAILRASVTFLKFSSVADFLRTRIVLPRFDRLINFHLSSSANKISLN
jgi:hypothetical protein